MRTDCAANLHCHIPIRAAEGSRTGALVLCRHFRNELDSGTIEAERRREVRRSKARGTPRGPAFVVVLEGQPAGDPQHAS